MEKQIVINETELLSLNLIYYLYAKEDFAFSGISKDTWLENFNHEHYQFVLLSNTPLYNQNQIEEKIMQLEKFKKNLLRKFFMFRVNILFISLNCQVSINYEELPHYIDFVCVKDAEDIRSNSIITEAFPEIVNEGLNKNIVEINYKLVSVNKERRRDIEKHLKYRKTPFLTYSIIGLFLLTFILTSFSSNWEYIWVRYFIKYDPKIVEGEWWRLITANFSNNDLISLGLLSAIFYFFGKTCEQIFGYKRFFIIVFISSVVGMLFHFAFHNNISYGSYPIIAGVIGALFYYSINNRRYFSSLLTRTIIPLIFINVVFSIIFPNQIYYGMLGGLVAGFLVAGAIGAPKYFHLKKGILSMAFLIIIIVTTIMLGINDYKVINDVEEILRNSSVI